MNIFDKVDFLQREVAFNDKRNITPAERNLFLLIHPEDYPEYLEGVHNYFMITNPFIAGPFIAGGVRVYDTETKISTILQPEIGSLRIVTTNHVEKGEPKVLLDLSYGIKEPTTLDSEA